MNIGLLLFFPNTKGLPGLMAAPWTRTVPNSPTTATITSHLLTAVPPVVITASHDFKNASICLKTFSGAYQRKN